MRLVTTLQADTPEGLLQLARRSETEWVEVRLDALRGQGIDVVPQLHARLRRPSIATCRPEAEGGRFRGREAIREGWLLAAIEAGFEAVDVEADAPGLRRLADRAARRGTEVIVSRHDLQGPDPARAEALAARVPPGGIAKYVARVEGPEDLAGLIEAAARLRDAGVRHAVMGLGDASLRLLAPLLGSALVYCAPPGSAPAAPGQLPAHLVARAHAMLPAQPLPALRAGHRLVLLLGDPVEGSLSPVMQNAAFAAAGDPLLYAAVQVRQLPEAIEALRRLGAAGANVTAPHKRAAAGLVSKLAPRARACGSVNTIVARRGQLVGENTDGDGAIAALREAGAEPHGARALVVGTGGAARAVAHALHREGAELSVAGRSTAEARSLARALGGEAVPLRRPALAKATAGATLLAQCTPVGAGGAGSLLSAAALHDKLVVLDAVYRQGGTPLVRAARARGCVAVPGEAMLLHQGALAYTLWTGKPAPLGAMRGALLHALAGGAP